MGVNFGKFVGYGLAAGAFAAKIILLANAFKMLALASAMLTKTPMGLAVAGVVIGGGLAFEAYNRATATTTVANGVAGQYTKATNQQNVNVSVAPQEGMFANAVDVRIQDWSSARLTGLDAGVAG